MTDGPCIITVWGPTAEWGDGSGPLFYTDSLKSAGWYVRDERRTTVDYVYQIADLDGSDVKSAELDALEGRALYERCAQLAGWPTNQIGYWLESDPAADVASRAGFDGDPNDIEDLLDYLNGA